MQEIQLRGSSKCLLYHFLYAQVKMEIGENGRDIRWIYCADTLAFYVDYMYATRQYFCFPLKVRYRRSLLLLLHSSTPLLLSLPWPTLLHFFRPPEPTELMTAIGIWGGVLTQMRR